MSMLCTATKISEKNGNMTICSVH